MRSSSYIEWYNENEGRSYPIMEKASKTDNSRHQLPDDIIVDLGLMVTPGLQSIFLSSVRITDYSVTVGLSAGSTGVFVGTYLRNELQPQTAYPLTSLLDNVSGWIVFGNHIASGVEYYRFSTYAQSGIAQRAVHVIDSLPITHIAKYGGNPLQKVDGVVRLVAGAGVVIEQDDSDPQKIIIRMEQGMAHAMAGPCNESTVAEQCGVPPMRSIDGVCPDEDGKITLRFE